MVSQFDHQFEMLEHMVNILSDFMINQAAFEQ